MIGSHIFEAVNLFSAFNLILLAKKCVLILWREWHKIFIWYDGRGACHAPFSKIMNMLFVRSSIGSKQNLAT